MDRDVAPIFFDIAKELGFLTAEQAAEGKKAFSDASPDETHGTVSQVAIGKNLLSRIQIMAIKDEMRQRGVWPPLPGYELLERLGEGSMGSVYKARQLSLDRIVALKLLATRLARDADYIKRFRREARLAAKLSHPNAVHVYNVEENARRHYIVMEFVDGPDVSKLIAKGPMGERAALEIIRGAALALGQAHEHGIIHRDIKPANILLTTKGQPKLSDLGLAKQVGSGSLTEHGLAVGTPFYMSPEQCRSDRGMDGRADIYSLGATLFHMLCGEPPFRGGGTLAIISKHVQEQLPDPRTRNPSLSDETAKLIQRMMAKDPVLRFQTCADLVKAVDKLLATIKDKAGTSTVVVPSDVGAASKEPDEHVAPTGFITWKARKRCVTAVTPKGEMKKEFTYFTNSIGMKFIHLPAGTFVMGSPEDEDGRADDEGPVHRVRISQPFYMGAQVVTKPQFKLVMGSDPSHLKRGSQRPVEGVSWNDAKAFCGKLSEMEGAQYRLPTEAEWEYACRAGTITPFSSGETISPKVANYDPRYTYANGRKGKYRGTTTPVNQFPPNAWGLYDMHGNVWEWCEDWYDEHYYTSSPEVNPQGPLTGRFRVLRGGSWLSLPGSCRSATRYKYVPTDRDYNIGFRVVCVPRV